MKEREKSIKKYYRKIRSLLPCNRKTKAAIMQQISENIEGYLSENPNAGFEEIQTQFGAPETIAAAYVESTGTAEILKSLHVRSRIATAATVVITVALVALLGWSFFLRWAAVEAEKSMSGTIEIITGVVEDGDTNDAVGETDDVSYAP